MSRVGGVSAGRSPPDDEARPGSGMNRRYVVLGIGAVGGALAGLLQLAGARVIAVARGAQLAALRAGPLSIEMPSRAESVMLDVVDGPESVAFEDGDVVLLCTKSQHVASALVSLRRAAPPELQIVCAQNGVAAERMARDTFDRVYGMVFFAPATHLEAGRITLHSEPVLGALDVGVWPEGTDALAEAIVADLRKAGFEAHAEARIRRLKYGKLLTNVANIVQALAGPAAHPLVRRVQDEAIACYRALGIDYAPLEEIAERYGAIRELPVRGAARGGGSTWQSLARRTGTLETDWLNGEIVSIGAAAGIDAACSRALVELAHRAAAEGWPPGRMTVAELAAALDEVTPYTR